MNLNSNFIKKPKYILLLGVVILCLSFFLVIKYQNDTKLVHVDGGIARSENKVSIQEKQEIISRKNNKISQEVDNEVKVIKVVDLGYRDSSDLFALALELLDAAKEGDAASQYYLSKIILICGLILDSGEIAQNYAQTNLEMEIMERTSVRCVQFTKENIQEFGNPNSWLKLSSDSSYGPAIVAQLMLSDPSDNKQKTLIDLSHALVSHHPDTLYYISGLGKNNINSAAWQLLACDFGMDCSASSTEEWVYGMASHCSVYRDSSQVCIDGMDFDAYIHTKLSDKEYLAAIRLKKHFRNLLDNNRLDEFSLDDFLN